MTVIQQELIPRPHSASFIEAIRSRLPQHDFLRVSDVAAACDVDRSVVYAWIDEGLIDAMNYGGKADGKATYHILRASVINLYERRSNAV